MPVGCFGGEATIKEKVTTMSEQDKLERLLGMMLSYARENYRTAASNAARLQHRELGEVHLLLGILGVGNKDRTAPIPRILREEFGADYGVLYEFLENNVELRAGASATRPAKPTRGLLRTLERAVRMAKRRSGRNTNKFAVITEDLLLALLYSRDPLLMQSFATMGVDKGALVNRLRPNRQKRSGAEASSSHLHLVN